MTMVIVFGKDRYNTLGVIRSLGRKNVPVFLLLMTSSTPSYCQLSRYVKGIRRVRSAEDGIRYLLEDYVISNVEKTVIIPTSDSVASQLDLHFDELSSKYIFPNAGSPGALTSIMNKNLMTEIASESGLHTPHTIEYVCGEALPQDISFPCIVKPAKSIDGTKSEIKICLNNDDIIAATSYQDKGHRVLIQRLVDKDYEVLLLGCRCTNGKVLLSGVFKKERWVSIGDDGSFGIITSNYSKWFDKLVVERFLENLNYVGPFSIECGVEKEIPYFYEINLRNDGTSHYFDNTGFCAAYAWVMESLGRSFDYSSNGDYYFIDEFEDFINVVKHNCTLQEWWRDRKKASVFKYKCAEDRKPMLVILPYMLARIIRNILKVKCKNEY